MFVDVMRIHIHAGKTCATHNLIGGHYWNSDTLGSDPWSDIVIDGADGSVSVDFGYTEDESKYRAFVIHDHNGVTYISVGNFFVNQ